MLTISQQEFENDFDTYYQYVQEHHEGIVIVSDDGNKVLLKNFVSYQLLVNKKITISGDIVTQEPLSDSDRTELLNTL